MNDIAIELASTIWPKLGKAERTPSHLAKKIDQLWQEFTDASLIEWGEAMREEAKKKDPEYYQVVRPDGDSSWADALYDWLVRYELSDWLLEGEQDDLYGYIGHSLATVWWITWTNAGYIVEPDYSLASLTHFIDEKTPVQLKMF